MPHSSQETKGRLLEWHPVHMEVWQDRGHVMPHTGLWRLRSRQRQLSDTSQVGLWNLSVCCCCYWLKGALSGFLVNKTKVMLTSKTPCVNSWGPTNTLLKKKTIIDHALYNLHVCPPASVGALQPQHSKLMMSCCQWNNKNSTIGTDSEDTVLGTVRCSKKNVRWHQHKLDSVSHTYNQS